MTITTQFNKGDKVYDVSRNKKFVVGEIRAQLFTTRDSKELLLIEYRSAKVKKNELIGRHVVHSGLWVPERNLILQKDMKNA